MKTAYRVPDNDCNCVMPGQKPDKTMPITRLNIRSFVTSHADGAQVPSGRAVELRGIAFNGGTGISPVLVSPDGLCRGSKVRNARTELRRLAGPVETRHVKIKINLRGIP